MTNKDGSWIFHYVLHENFLPVTKYQKSIISTDENNFLSNETAQHTAKMLKWNVRLQIQQAANNVHRHQQKPTLQYSHHHCVHKLLTFQIYSHQNYT